MQQGTVFFPLPFSHFSHGYILKYSKQAKTLISMHPSDSMASEIINLWVALTPSYLGFVGVFLANKTGATP